MQDERIERAAIAVCQVMYPEAWKTGKQWGTFPSSTQQTMRHAARAALLLQEEAVRYCPECGYVGEVGDTHASCCPDGSAARYVPKRFAEMCADTFRRYIRSMPSAVPDNLDEIRPVTGIATIQSIKYLAGEMLLQFDDEVHQCWDAGDRVVLVPHKA